MTSGLELMERESSAASRTNDALGSPKDVIWFEESARLFSCVMLSKKNGEILVKLLPERSRLRSFVRFATNGRISGEISPLMPQELRYSVSRYLLFTRKLYGSGPRRR